MKSRQSIVIVVIVLVPLILGACRPRKEEKGQQPAAQAQKIEEKVGEVGVTDTEILIGQWGPQTGPAALWGAVARGTAAYFEMINEEGGIFGRKLRLIIKDDAYQPARTIAVTKELVEKDKVFAVVGGVGTATGMAVKDYLAEKGVPWIGPASGSSKLTKTFQRNLFSLYPSYDLEAKVIVRYIVEELKKEKIAFFYQNDDYGKEGLEGARSLLEKLGKKLVAEVSVEVADTDVSSHVMKLKESGAEVVILWLLPKHAAQTVGTAAKLGFKPQWVTGSTLSDAEIMHKLTQGLWEGTIYTTFAELPDSDHPLVKKYRAAFVKYALPKNPNEQWGIFFLAGFVFAEPLVEAIRMAGRDLTREKLIENLEKLNRWDGGISHHITFGPNQRDGARYVRLVRCQGGKGVVISDWLTAQ